LADSDTNFTPNFMKIAYPADELFLFSHLLTNWKELHYFVYYLSCT